MQPNIQAFTRSRSFNRFHSRLYRVNGVLTLHVTLAAFRPSAVHDSDFDAGCHGIVGARVCVLLCNLRRRSRRIAEYVGPS